MTFVDLSAKKYLDEKPKTQSTEKVDLYPLRLRDYKKVVAQKMSRNYVSQQALQHIEEVQRAIKEGEFTKDEAELYLDLRGWL